MPVARPVGSGCLLGDGSGRRSGPGELQHNGEVLHHFATQCAGEGGGELEPQRDAQALAVGRDTLAGCAPFLLERQPRSGRWAVAMPHGDSTRVFHPTVPRRVRMKTEAGVAYLLRSVVPKKRVTQHADGCIPPSIRKRQSGEMRTVNGRLAALRAPHGGPSAQLPCGACSATSRPLTVQ